MRGRVVIKGIFIAIAVMFMGAGVTSTLIESEASAASGIIAAEEKEKGDSPIDQGWNKAKTSTGIEKDGTPKDENTIVQNIITFLIWLVGILAVIMIIIGGIMYTTSAGDPGKAKKAKDTIMYGIIGLVIAVFVFAIVNFVMDAILK